MTTPDYPPDPDGRVACMRVERDTGKRLGWCGVRHRYQDRGETHVRVLNRGGGVVPRTYDAWVLVPLTVAEGKR